MMRTTAMRHIRRLRTEGKLKNEGTMLQIRFMYPFQDITVE